MKFGSHLYGTDTPSSDTDYKGIYLPEAKDCYLDNIKHTIDMSTGNSHSKNTKEDIDETNSNEGNLLVAVSHIKEQQIKSGKSKGKLMATLTIEDLSSISEVTLFSDQYEELKDKLDYCSLLFFPYKATKKDDFLRIRPVGKITLIK